MRRALGCVVVMVVLVALSGCQTLGLVPSKDAAEAYDAQVAAGKAVYEALVAEGKHQITELALAKAKAMGASAEEVAAADLANTNAKAEAAQARDVAVIADSTAKEKLQSLASNTELSGAVSQIISGVTRAGPFGLPIDVPTIVIGLVGLAGVLFGAKKSSTASTATSILGAVIDGVQVFTEGKTTPADGGVTGAIQKAALTQGVETKLRALLDEKDYLKG